MTVRVFIRPRASWEEIGVTDLAGVTWTETVDGPGTCEVRLTTDAPPTSGLILIVPSERQERTVPCYGPYESLSTRYTSPIGSTIPGQIGRDYNLYFGKGDASVLAVLGDQIDALAQRGYEPFQGWTSSRGSTDGPHVAKLGATYVDQATASLWQVSDLVTASNALGGFGLRTLVTPYPTAAGGWRDELTILPRYPLARPFAGATIYNSIPPFNVVQSWSDTLPEAFARRIADSNKPLPEGAWLQRPTVATADDLNGVDPARGPTWETRRIVAGYRGLGFEDQVVFHTGLRVPSLFMDPVVGDGLVAKFAEELRRWDMQNTAATWVGTRVVDDTWTDLEEVVITPDQILLIPADQLPDGWPEDKRQWAVRSVRHVYDPRVGYQQVVEANLWQGEFKRLEAVG